MGGNALKHVGVERKQRDEYFDIANDVVTKLTDIFGEWIDIIPCFHRKETFGDADILIASERIPDKFIEIIRSRFSPQAIIQNGDATSFDYRGMQIDLIKSPMNEYLFALNYFSYNDLGNFIGRIAHKMGFKFGHDGLWVKAVDGDQKLGEICITLSFFEALKFLGYQSVPFLNGFNTLEDIYEFASSSPYFHRDIFQLENRNHASRVRDAKRPNYNGFLKWMEDKPHLDKYQWVFYKLNERPPEREAEKADWLTRVQLAFPHVTEKINKIRKDRENALAVKKIWNGVIVGAITGYKGEKLGEFLGFCRDIPFGKENFDNWILSLKEGEIKTFVEESVKRYETEVK